MRLNWRHHLAGGLLVWFFCWFIAGVMPATAQTLSLSNLEQQIVISNGEFTTTNNTDSPTNNALGLVYFNSSEYSGATVYFEAIARCDACSGGNAQMSVSLYSASGASQQTLFTSSSTYTRLRSGSIVIPEGEYTVRFKLDADSGTAYLKAARLVIVQNSNPITDTVTHIELGGYDSTTNTSATSLTSPKYYRYDDQVYSGNVSSYFEATLKTSDNDEIGTYYYNSTDSQGEQWEFSPNNMANNNTTNFASTNTDGDIQRLDGNTASDTDLGQINRVRIRAFGYQTDGTDGQVLLRPVFGGSTSGDDQTFTPNQGSGSADWSSWFDITEDANAPSTWLWSHVNDLDLEVEFAKGADANNTAFIASLEVEVSYEDNTVVAYAQLYNRSDGQVVTTVSTSDNDYDRIRSDQLSSNWDLSNPDEYEVRIYSSTGTSTASLSNAKIVHVQDQGTGLTAVELHHPLITTARSQTNSTYTQESYFNQFDPSSFANTNVVRAYYEATMRTSTGTGHSALYDTNASNIIDDPNNSELVTSSTSFQRLRSPNLSFNTDWPTISSELTSILKNESGATTYVSNSSLVIQAVALAPELSFTITGVADNQTNNGITTDVTTTTSTIPFGNFGMNEPRFAAQALNVTTNDAVTNFNVYVQQTTSFQGVYPANNIDPFAANGATWGNPQAWATPTGTTRNEDTGWFGANTSDSQVSGWSGDTSGLFGPVSSNPVMVMTGSRGLDKTVTVSYGVEVNLYQPADMYATNIIYTILPIY